MKKMNFYFNFGRCRMLLLAIMMFGGFSTLVGQTVTVPLTDPVKTDPTAKCLANGSITVSPANPDPIVYPIQIHLKVQKTLSSTGTAVSDLGTTVYDQMITYTGAAGSTLPTTITVPGLTPGRYVVKLDQVTVGSTIASPTIIGTPVIDNAGLDLAGASTAPTATPSANVTVNASAQCTYSVTPASIATSSDDCAVRSIYISETDYATLADLIAAVTATPPTASSTAIDLVGAGAHTVYYYAVDGEGQMVKVSKIVTLKDVTPSVFQTYLSASAAISGSGQTNSGGLSCGATFSTKVDCVPGTAEFTYPTVLDACDPAINPAATSSAAAQANSTVMLVTMPAGATYAAGVVTLPAGNHTLTFRALDAAGNETFCTYTVNIGIIGSNVFTCPGNLNISIVNCPQVLTLEDLLGSDAACVAPGTVVEIGRAGVWTNGAVANSAMLMSTDIGKTIQYRIRATVAPFNSCWGNMTIEDKAAPTITCVPNITLKCTQNPTDTKITGDIAGATNANSTSTNDGLYSDCSKVTQASTDYRAYNSECVVYTDVDAFYYGPGTVFTAPTVFAAGTVFPVGTVFPTGTLFSTGVAPVLGVPYTGTVTLTLPLTVPAGTILLAPAPTIATATPAGVAVPANSIKIIARTWTVKDAWGNISLPCTQVIFVTKDPTTDIGVDYYRTGKCSDTDVSPAALKSWPYFISGTGGGAILGNHLLEGSEVKGDTVKVGASAVCGVSVTGYTDLKVTTCGNGYKIIRTWTIVDMCAAGSMTDTIEQVLFFEDKIAPKAKITYQNYSRKKSWDCFVMNGMKMENQEIWSLVPTNPVTTDSFSSSAITLTPRADANICDAAQILFTIKATDAICGNGNVTFTSNDSRILINGASTVSVAGNVSVTVTGMVMKSQGNTFSITVTDPCGNESVQNFTVNIIDNMAPNVVCIQDTRATLGSDGTVRISAASFNSRSTDNCGIARIHARRMTVGASNTCGAASVAADTCYNEFVDFNCSDVGKTIQVVLHVVDGAVDANGNSAPNFSDCMINVIVDDKTTPLCVDGAPIARLCTDVDLNNYKALFTRPAAYDNCGVTVKDSTITELSINCGKGTSTATWTFQDCAGNTASCSQTLNVSTIEGFRVPILADETLSCAYEFDLSKERTKIVNGMALLNAAGTKTCSSPVVEVEYWKYSSTNFCQIYRIRYTVIDYCNPRYNYTGTAVGTVNTASGYIQDDARVVVYERFVNVRDLTAPISTPPSPDDICVTSNVCTFDYSKTLKGEDNCGPGTWEPNRENLTFMWRATNEAGETVATGNTSAVALTGLAFGTYKISYRVTDLCGNMSPEYSFNVTGKDCKAPEILVHDKIVALAGQTGNWPSGMATLTYDDIKNALRDNCTSEAILDSYINMEHAVGDPVAPTTARNRSVQFTCGDAGETRKVRVWTRDAAGNWNFATSSIKVQDNNGICGSHGIVLSGNTRTEDNSVVNNVSVSANVNGVAVATAAVANGTFSLAMTAATNVQVRASKTNADDAATGVTTFDIAKISQHVLDVEKFVSPYKLIASDVDKSGEIDATDMLHMRRFILKITPSLPGGNFRFIDKAYTFRNATNPFGEDFPEVVNIASLTANTVADFVAVKLGDVNGSYNGTLVRSTRTLSFLADDMNVVAGNEYTVNISADKIDASAFQGTFSFNGATVKSVKSGNLANMTDGNFGIFANAVTTSWNGKTQAAADVFAITFVANKSGKLSDMLTINSALTQAIANDATGAEMNVNLKFNTGKVAGGEFALYQNQPNPVANETSIGFNLPKEGAARLTITAVDGKVVKVINGNYKAGYNTINVNKSDLNASGVFYYRLETADHSASKKMVIIE